MPSPGKTKGNTWEREVATFLSSLYGEQFLRVPNSGAAIGGANAYRKQTMSADQTRMFKGDIIPGPSFPKLNIEAKFYKDFPFHQLIVGECKMLDGWLTQIKTTCDPDDLNMLVMKFNRKGAFVAYEEKFMKKFKQGDSFLVYENTATTNGKWIIDEYTRFWTMNSKIVKKHAF